MFPVSASTRSIEDVNRIQEHLFKNSVVIVNYTKHSTQLLKINVDEAAP